MSYLVDIDYVNWEDGMKVSGSHFRASDVVHEASVRDASALGVSEIHYGLIPSANKHYGKESFFLKIDYQKLLNIDLREIHAIAPDGTRIEINPTDATAAGGLNQTLATDSLMDKKSYYLAIATHWKKKTPYGDPNPEEVPIRVPYLKSVSEFILVTEDVFKTNRFKQNYVPFTKLFWENGYYEVDEAYIPPCINFQAHYLMVEMFAFFQSHLSDIEFCLTKLLHKINNIGLKSSLAKSFHQVGHSILNQTISINSTLKIKGNSMSPAEMAVNLTRLVKIVRVAMEILDGKAKEEYLGYLGGWMDIPPGEYESIISDIENQAYEHFDALLFWNNAKSFVKFHYLFFDKLLKLDNFKKMKDSDVFISEKYMGDEEDEMDEPIDNPITADDHSNAQKKKWNWTF